ncbi:MAG: purine-nucleoside phosphorylase [candidate division KSB1 bacterium]|nr:purine-nucleoside phosphorylase [candidate division KSB1 bacterium]MDZ7274382.1 purine-nucleoside phosphorylase [candidate division KSB1 bacterium]MDZ7284956.1 purine-nucleoside phosphorylase [candidate division KSB1 bacterium]MDZ7297623.1 purine-nucleoside phosphorylase [candidate division KSB1 bacterium]MDZ7306363.1 purine-nucleoside phosphorylase [candidate division KSB1 bacterium]
MTPMQTEMAPPLLDAERLATAKAFVQQRFASLPRLAIILGSGLGSFADSMQDTEILPTAQIPEYPRSTVAGHAGCWIIGRVGGKRLLALQGRVHTYEGYPASVVGFPVHLMAELGVKRLIVTNAAGGLNPLFRPGDLMLIDDHINFMFTNPLRGQHRREWGERWPDMHAPYDPGLQGVALEAARQLGIPLRRGVLFASKGPSYETAAEVRMAQRLGADAATMSTVPEVLVAVARRLEVLGISCITNLCTGLTSQKLDHAEVTEVANRISTTFQKLLHAIIKQIG